MDLSPQAVGKGQGLFRQPAKMPSALIPAIRLPMLVLAEED